MLKIGSSFLLLMIASTASAADRILVRQAVTLAGAIRTLDSKATGGTPSYEFGSGILRLKLANDLAIVEAVERAMEITRQNIVREIMKKTGGAEIRPGTPEFEDFANQYAEALEQPAAGTQDLASIKASELKLDKNEIPIAVLTALKPILDAD